MTLDLAIRFDLTCCGITFIIFLYGFIALDTHIHYGADG